MRWAWARIDELEKMKKNKLSFFDVDFLDEELAPIIAESHSLVDRERALDCFAHANERSPALPDIAKLIGWMAPGSEHVTDLMVEMLEDADLGWPVRAYLMDLPLDDEELDERATAFAQRLEEPTEPLHELIKGRLPRSWSGSYMPHLKEARAVAERWAGSLDGELAAAGREAVGYFSKRIKAEEASEAAEELALSYR